MGVERGEDGLRIRQIPFMHADTDTAQRGGEAGLHGGVTAPGAIGANSLIAEPGEQDRQVRRVVDIGDRVEPVGDGRLAHLRPNSFSMSPWASFTQVGRP